MTHVHCPQLARFEDKWNGAGEACSSAIRYRRTSTEAAAGSCKDMALMIAERYTLDE